MVGHPDWFGTPLVGAPSRVFGQGLAIPAGASVNQFVQFSKPGYLVNVRPQYSGASGATPFCRVNFKWVDANPLTLDLGQNDWIVPVRANATYSPTIGSGPVRGPWAYIQISNLDLAQPITCFIDLWETTGHIARDDWRDASIYGYVASPGMTAAPGANPGRNELAQLAVTLGINTFYQLPLYAGQAFLSLNITPPAGGNVQFVIEPIVGQGQLYTTGLLAASTVLQDIAVTLPREPCQIQISPSAAGAVIVGGLTIMEYAS